MTMCIGSEVETVFEFIEENEPIDQDKLVNEFGNHGLKCVRELMLQNKVSYTLEWDLQTEV